MSHVFVSSPTQADQNRAAVAYLLAQLPKKGDCVCCLQCRDDAFGSGKEMKRLKRLTIRYGNILRPTRVFQMGMLWAHSRIIQAGRNRMGRGHLTILIL